MFKDIYFFRSSVLALRLKNGEVSEFNALKNFIFYVAIFSYGYEVPVKFTPSISVEAEPLTQQAIFWLVSALMNAFGLFYVYNTNSQGDGNNFFQRFCSLSLSVSVKVSIILIVVLLISVVMAVVFEISEDSISNTFVYGGVLMTTVFLSLFYWLMNRYISIATGIA